LERFFRRCGSVSLLTCSTKNQKARIRAGFLVHLTMIILSLYNVNNILIEIGEGRENSQNDHVVWSTKNTAISIPPPAVTFVIRLRKGRIRNTNGNLLETERYQRATLPGEFVF